MGRGVNNLSTVTVATHPQQTTKFNILNIEGLDLTNNKLMIIKN